MREFSIQLTLALTALNFSVILKKEIHYYFKNYNFGIIHLSDR